MAPDHGTSTLRGYILGPVQLGLGQEGHRNCGREICGEGKGSVTTNPQGTCWIKS